MKVRALHLRAFSMGLPSFTLLIATWLAVVYNLPFWSKIVDASGGDILGRLAFHGSVFALVVLGFTVLLSLLSFRFTTKPAVILILLLASVVAGFMQRYGVLIDRSMIQNVFETDWREARDLISMRLVLTVVLLGIVPAAVVARIPLHFRPWRREVAIKLAILCASGVAMAGFMFSFGAEYASLFRNHRELRFMLTPTNAIQSSFSYFKGKSNQNDVTIDIPHSYKKEAWAGREKPVVLVLVVGETARAADFSLNGHERETNPLLQREDIINFSNVTSCGTATAVSLPCMFSDLGRERFEQKAAMQRGNLLDVLARADINVLWRDNNSGCKGICARVASEDLSDANVQGLCDSGECFDEVLTHGLQERMDTNGKPQVIVLHQKGSHGPAYSRRYPPQFEKFKPACQSVDLARCPPEEIHNAYDNTILYTDYVLAKVIDILKKNSDKVDSALLYVSDHGESLGEFGLYLHGAPRAIAPAVQYEIPMLAWFSSGFASTMGLDVSCVRSKARNAYSHDNLFHSVTGLLDVATASYRQDRDLFHGCRHYKEG
ncbi:phosphoethanolamine--lipid A transferase [Noviherbaspirillum agri]